MSGQRTIHDAIDAMRRDDRAIDLANVKSSLAALEMDVFNIDWLQGPEHTARLKASAMVKTKTIRDLLERLA